MAPLRGALLGYGFIAERGHLPAWLSAPNDARIVAVVDHRPERLAMASARLPEARMFDSLDALFASDVALDFVDVALPPYMHAAAAHAALDRGLHVLCEKPLATTYAEARGMLEHAARAERVIFPCHNYKHAPVVTAVREALDRGDIGPVRFVTLHTFRPTHARGVRAWRPDWRREKQYAGGGIAMDHGSHTFYLAFDWLGSFPIKVSAQAWALEAHDTEDNLSCAITFPNGLATAHLSWTAGVRKVIYTLQGARGAIRVEDDDLEVSVALPGDPPQRWESTRTRVSSDWMDAGHGPWFVPLQKRFLDAIRARTWVGHEALTSLRCVELIGAAYASSAKGGREVPLHQEALP